MHTQEIKSLNRSELDSRIEKNNAMVQLEELSKLDDVCITFDFDGKWCLWTRGNKEMIMSASENALHRLEQVYIKMCG